MERVAIVGTGVAGLGCAWNLRDAAHLTLIEKDTRPGGHTNTVDVEEDGRRLPIDTGFIVFNRVTYPNLCRLFTELGVEAKPSEMSFSVQHLASGLEYNGMGPNKLFAQRRNLFRPRFLALVAKILHFFHVGRAALNSTEAITMREFAEKHRLGEDFLNYYLVPMSSAVWSTDPRDVLNFPATTLLRFFHNHGFLGVTTHHKWLTVAGGARTYLEKILDVVGKPRLGNPAVSVSTGPEGATLRFADGSSETFDRVILACHGDEALALLSDPDPLQRELLGPFRYQRNEATLHTWEGVMPKARRAWASWNYRVAEDANNGATTHYWMNALQGISDKKNYFVSLNSKADIPRRHVLYETVYEHPVFSLPAIRAQEKLPSLNTRSHNQRVFFCGSYFKYGFHEDAYTSGLELARVLRGFQSRDEPPL